MKVLGIIAAAADPMGKLVRKKALEMGARVKLIDTWKLGEGSLATLTSPTWARDADCDGYYLRSAATSYALRVRLHKGLHEPIAPNELEHRADILYSWGLFVEAWLDGLEQTGKPMLNKFSTVGRADNKSVQMRVLHEAGIAIPDTLITNDQHEVRRFVKRHHDQVVFKSLSGGTVAQQWKREQIKHLALLKVEPMIFQRLHDGENLRVTIVDGRVVSAVGIRSDTLDYRDSPDFRAHKNVYYEVTLSKVLERTCLKAARVCGQRLSGIDVKRDGKHFVVLECNSSPVFIDIESMTGASISEAIARALLR